MSKIIDIAIQTTGIYETTDARSSEAVEAELRADDRCDGGCLSVDPCDPVPTVDAWGKRDDGSKWHARVRSR